MRPSAHIIVLGVLAAVGLAARAGELAGGGVKASKEGVEFFEKEIRPILAQYCYECHSAQAKKIKGKLLLDSRQGMLKGGADGVILVPGDPEGSRLITAIRWSDTELKMPPKQKLSAQQIEKFEQWVRMGAPDPREEASTNVGVAKGNTSLETGRKWWAFQPIAEMAPPAIKQQTWPKKK